MSFDGLCHSVSNLLLFLFLPSIPDHGHYDSKIPRPLFPSEDSRYQDTKDTKDTTLAFFVVTAVCHFLQHCYLDSRRSRPSDPSSSQDPMLDIPDYAILQNQKNLLLFLFGSMWSE
jgi:hypothetical protein